MLKKSIVLSFRDEATFREFVRQLPSCNIRSSDYLVDEGNWRVASTDPVVLDIASELFFGQPDRFVFTESGGAPGGG